MSVADASKPGAAQPREGEEMKGMECSSCGAPARVVHGTYDLREVGLKSVVLHGIEIVKCPKCKNEDPIIPNMNGLMRALALAVIEKPYRLTGEEVRFIRLRSKASLSRLASK
jgi:hypothetical protein